MIYTGIIQIKNAPNQNQKYKRELISDRLCTLCAQDDVKDELNFLLYCTKYSNLRTEYFNNIGYGSTQLMSD